MFVLDTDIVTAALHKNSTVLSRIRRHSKDVWISIVAVEEMVGPAIAQINKARGDKIRDDVQRKYDFLYTLFDALRLLQVLPYPEEADQIYKNLPASAKAKGKMIVGSPPSLFLKNGRSLPGMSGTSRGSCGSRTGWIEGKPSVS